MAAKDPSGKGSRVRRSARASEEPSRTQGHADAAVCASPGVGHGSEERRTFHGLRNTFTEAMEQAGVPESTTQLIVGHKRQSLTYGHYSKGERLRKDLREYIGRLRYSKDVMKLIRGP
jgi:integrase